MIVTAMVSPSARPSPSIEPPTMPERAERQHGHADHLPARRAERRARPRRWVRGVRANTSRVIALMIGRIMIARTKPTTEHGAPGGRRRPVEEWDEAEVVGEPLPADRPSAGPSTAMPQSP